MPGDPHNESKEQSRGWEQNQQAIRQIRQEIEAVSKGDVHFFERKARFFERKHQRQAGGLVVISPTVDRRALDLAASLGVQVYSYVEDIDPSTFG